MKMKMWVNLGVIGEQSGKKSRKLGAAILFCNLLVNSILNFTTLHLYPYSNSHPPSPSYSKIKPGKQELTEPLSSSDSYFWKVGDNKEGSLGDLGMGENLEPKADRQIQYINSLSLLLLTLSQSKLHFRVWTNTKPRTRIKTKKKKKKTGKLPPLSLPPLQLLPLPP